MYALNPDGSLKWRFATGGHVGTAPSILPDGTIVVGSQDNLIYGIKPDGTKRWDFRAGDDVELKEFTRAPLAAPLSDGELAAARKALERPVVETVGV